QFGVHYTTEKNIFRTIRPLFLDVVSARLESADTRPKLQAFIDDLAEMTILDPACGRGDFLVVTYRELRRLEVEALRRLRARSVRLECRVRLDHFYGIEIEESSAEITRAALYQIEERVHREVLAEFGPHEVSLSEKTAPPITIGNALQIDWHTILPATKC